MHVETRCWVRKLNKKYSRAGTKLGLYQLTVGCIDMQGKQ